MQIVCDISVVTLCILIRILESQLRRSLIQEMKFLIIYQQNSTLLILKSSFMLKAIHHVQIAVSKDLEEATINFYKDMLELKEIEKPENLKKNGGAWFEIGLQQFHIAPEDVPFEYNSKSKRHLCFIVENLMLARDFLVRKGVEIIEDNQPIKGWSRFYFRDPGGNRIEFAEILY